MNSGERTYSKSEIRERRLALQQQLTLQQRQLDALAKMDDAADELERVELEMAALSRGEAQPEEPEQAVPGEPQTIGPRALTILEEHPNKWLTPRDILAEMEKRGWMDTDPDHAIQRLRHSLRRLAHSNPQVERDENGTTFRYRYVSRVDVTVYRVPQTPATVSHANRPAYAALQLNVDGAAYRVPQSEANGSGYPVLQPSWGKPDS